MPSITPDPSHKPVDPIQPKDPSRKRGRPKKVTYDPLLMSQAERRQLRLEQDLRFKAALAKGQEMKRGPGRPRKSPGKAP